MVMLPEILSLAVMSLAWVAEWIHSRRIQKVQRLAFGPGRAALWTWTAPLLRTLSLGMATWGFASLLWVVQPRVHNLRQIPDDELKHLVLIVDVSPSMHLQDAGPEGNRSRRQRASDVLESLFNRIPMQQFKVSLIGVYTDAKPLLEDSRDYEVVRHILESMPMFHAFKPGKTRLLDGISQATEMVKDWKPGSTFMLLLTDGDTVPAQGMPTLPPAVAEFVVVGLGDPSSGKFIDGHQSRQDIATLRQIANRLRGVYHNGNQKHLTSQIVGRLTQSSKEDQHPRWTRREWSLAAVLTGATLFGVLPLLLHYFGTGYRPGVRVAPE